ALAARAARLHAADGTASVVVDCETGPVRLGLAGQLARELGGTAVTLDELRADAIAGLVRDVREAGHAPRTGQAAQSARSVRSAPPAQSAWRAA
ncbi:hypothetical protein ACWCPG_38080, partial [Streptomyces sp. NPDC001919]